MSDESTTSLLALQHADSFFPSGGIPLSAGLETLFNDGKLAGEADLDVFLRGQLSNRWASFDRPALVAVFRAKNDLDSVAAIDATVDAQTLAAESRIGSVRAGKALLGVHVKLGTANAPQYRKRIAAGHALGHNVVIQGLMWGGAGLSEPQIEMMSAHMFCVGIVSAALRLGAIGHISAQTTLGRAHATLDRILEQSACAFESAHAFVPQQEIAVMRHETSQHRLFAN